MRITGRLNKLETVMGLRGPCSVCGGRSRLRIVIDVPGKDAMASGSECCEACGRAPLLIRIVPAVPPPLHRA